jgi:Kelch motif
MKNGAHFEEVVVVGGNDGVRILNSVEVLSLKDMKWTPGVNFVNILLPN